MRELVVSRYREDVQWTRAFSDFQITIYNKFDGLNLLENIGFEAHTYLYHLVNRYDSLADVTVFSQGRCFDHVNKRRFKDLMQSLDRQSYSGFTKPLICRKDGCPHHCGLNIQDFWNQLFVRSCPKSLLFHQGAIFSVPFHVIKRRPRTFYEKALSLVKTKQDACIMERLWCEIFFGTKIKH